MVLGEGGAIDVKNTHLSLSYCSLKINYLFIIICHTYYVIFIIYIINIFFLFNLLSIC
jgi:hypothetical protein